MTDLALKRDVAGNTQHKAFNAVAFFSRDMPVNPWSDLDALLATGVDHLGHVPSISNSWGLLQVFRDPADYPTNLKAF